MIKSCFERSIGPPTPVCLSENLPLLLEGEGISSNQNIHLSREENFIALVLFIQGFILLNEITSKKCTYTNPHRIANAIIDPIG